MVKSCCAYNCKQRYVKGSHITFHSFPKNEVIKKIWLQRIRRKDFEPTQNSVLCSKHFEESCFDKNRFGGTWLKPTAAPTIFDFSVKRNICKRPHPRKQLKPEKISLKSEPEDDENHLSPLIRLPQPNELYICSTLPPPSITEPELTITVLRPKFPIETPRHSVIALQRVSNDSSDNSDIKCHRTFDEFSVEDMKIPEKAEEALMLAKKEINDQRQKILQLTTKLQRSEQEISFLTAMVQELQNNCNQQYSTKNLQLDCNWSPHFLDPSVTIKGVEIFERK